ILAFLLIPGLGMYGAAVAFLLAKIIVVIIVYLMAREHNDVGYRMLDMIKIIMISLIFMGIGLYFSYMNYLEEFSFLNVLYKFVILLFYIVLNYFINKNYKKKIIRSNQWKKKLKKKKTNK